MGTLQGSSKRGWASGAEPSSSAALSATAVLRWVVANFEELVCAVILTMLASAVTAGVFFRYVLNAPLPWPEELSRFTLVWLTFIGASLAVKRQGHIIVDFAVHFLAPRARLWMTLAVQLTLIAFLILFAVLGIQLVQRTWVLVSTALSLRMGLVYLCVPLGSTLMIIHLIGQGLATARKLLTRQGH